MVNFKPQSGQSNYDICLEKYGSIDLIVKLCIDSEVEDINVVQKNNYSYDPNLIQDLNIAGYKYCTDAR